MSGGTVRPEDVFSEALPDMESGLATLGTRSGHAGRSGLSRRVGLFAATTSTAGLILLALVGCSTVAPQPSPSASITTESTADAAACGSLAVIVTETMNAAALVHRGEFTVAQRDAVTRLSSYNLRILLAGPVVSFQRDLVQLAEAAPAGEYGQPFDPENRAFLDPVNRIRPLCEEIGIGIGPVAAYPGG